VEAGGFATGISMIVVTPPEAAAMVPVAKSSLALSAPPRMWTWVSIIPGIISAPEASMVSLAESSGAPLGQTETILPSLTPTLPSKQRSLLTTVPPTMFKSFIAKSSCRSSADHLNGAGGADL
jgi:hypothetical protein